MNAELLLEVKRSNLVEREHSGFVVLVDKNGVISSVGDPSAQFFLRSCEKPLQALPILTSGAYKRFKITQDELAVCCASHTASIEHLNRINSVLKKIGLNESYLKCGIHDPIDPEMRKFQIKNDIPSSPIHNNCSGKHAGMLAVCVHKGYSLDNYLEYDQLLQLEIEDIIKSYSMVDTVKLSQDGCSAPTHGMPLSNMGIGLLNLFLDPEARDIKEAFIKHPMLAGGKGRIDSELMSATGGRLISKLGAEGLCIVINPEKQQALVVKVLDSTIQARSVATIEALKQLGWIDEAELKFEAIKKLFNLKILTLNGYEIGEMETTFKI